MSQVYLLRHAKAVWPSPGQKDFDRTLDSSGVESATVLGEEMKRAGLKPDIIICSTAVRARQTLEHINLKARLVQEELEKLYSGTADNYLMAIRMAGLEHESAGSVMLVGHNPMMEDVAIALAGRGDPPAHPTFAAGFPTAGLAVINFDSPLAEIRPGTGTLATFLSPSEHL
ncbi:histidine phosphatase family protein [Phyllobacterium sp. TAF24]|uniref:SixA phosphatase family protein n=1 Tax=Phyllobacterium TaxID=28100 RepID=UPI000886BF52|nr:MULTISPECIES: histidine phosphatase family protein [unclassified Phyllobacterium]UGX86935.1 histidine phosphatase family protein [Phyllobacterium sp. T1293]SDN91772.1 phosphohistidine phosphatase [Phyllobacterium sp. OV277]